MWKMKRSRIKVRRRGATRDRCNWKGFIVFWEIFGLLIFSSAISYLSGFMVFDTQYLQGKREEEKGWFLTFLNIHIFLPQPK